MRGERSVGSDGAGSSRPRDAAPADVLAAPPAAQPEQGQAPVSAEQYQAALRELEVLRMQVQQKGAQP